MGAVYNTLLYVRGPKTGSEEEGEGSGLLVLLYGVSQKWKSLFSLLGDRNMLVRWTEISPFPLALSAVSKRLGHLLPSQKVFPVTTLSE